MSLIARALMCVAVAVVAVGSGAADRSTTKQLLEQADAAAAAGKVEQAESVVCPASAQDQKNKQLRAKCDQYRKAAEAQREADHKHVNRGAAAMAMKNFDSAESEFRAIQSGSYANLKKEWLEKLAAARAQAEKESQNKEQERKLAEDAARRKEAESVMKANLDKGVAAYEKNDFAGARQLLAGITGSYQAQAQKYIGNIDQYNRAMNDGARYEKSGDSGRALSAYRKAAAIKANGPLNLKEKIANLQKGVPQTESVAETVAPSPAADEHALKSALQAYYKGDYAAAENQLSAYSGTETKMDALARFYLGASRLCRYFLLTDEAQKEQLWRAAIADLGAAKHMPEFVAPKEAVSPRVMEVYESSVP
ncbi:MAG TPA: hypothetical protein VN577_03545 [Terriglobales bacterium]|nr:hypothetical protein [Terriglobales bacterium]